MARLKVSFQDPPDFCRGAQQIMRGSKQYRRHHRGPIAYDADILFALRSYRTTRNSSQQNARRYAQAREIAFGGLMHQRRPLWRIALAESTERTIAAYRSMLDAQLRACK